MIIDFNVKEWEPNYLAFKDAGNVPPALTQLSTTIYQHTALGRRYWNPLGECFIYVLCDASRGRPIVAAGEWSINIPANTMCFVEDMGRGTGDAVKKIYNLYPTSETTVQYVNAITMYPFVSAKAAASTTLTKCWGLVKLLPCNSGTVTINQNTVKSSKRS